MRLGLVLPTFRFTPDAALAAAADAEAAGLDGVFCYDHLWPMGTPERPALAPTEVLATIAVRHERLTVGTLVARVGLVANDVLVSQLRALAVVADGRLICALGTGDKLSKAENVAYGVPYDPADVRRAELRSVASTLVDDGREVWVGGAAGPTRDLAAALGCTANVWDVGPSEVAETARVSAVVWAGPFPADDDGRCDLAAARTLAAGVREAGATWAVFGAPAGVADVAALADAAR